MGRARAGRRKHICEWDPCGAGAVAPLHVHVRVAQGHHLGEEAAVCIVYHDLRAHRRPALVAETPPLHPTPDHTLPIQHPWCSLGAARAGGRQGSAAAAARAGGAPGCNCCCSRWGAPGGYARRGAPWDCPHQGPAAAAARAGERQGAATASARAGGRQVGRHNFKGPTVFAVRDKWGSPPCYLAHRRPGYVAARRRRRGWRLFGGRWHRRRVRLDVLDVDAAGHCAVVPADVDTVAPDNQNVPPTPIAAPHGPFHRRPMNWAPGEIGTQAGGCRPMPPGPGGPPPATRGPQMAAAPPWRRRPAGPRPWTGQEGPAAGSGCGAPPPPSPSARSPPRSLPSHQLSGSQPGRGSKDVFCLMSSLLVCSVASVPCFDSPSAQPSWVAPRYFSCDPQSWGSFQGDPVCQQGKITITPAIPGPQRNDTLVPESGCNTIPKVIFRSFRCFSLQCFTLFQSSSPCQECSALLDEGQSRRAGEPLTADSARGDSGPKYGGTVSTHRGSLCPV
eukprot:gene5636-biopygen14793